MRVVLFDPYGGKFTDGMQKWWTEHGHEVKYERYYNPTLIPWGDVIFFDTADNNLKVATNPGEGILADWLKDGISPVDMHEMDLTGKKIIVRPIDIEVWQGSHADAKMWDLVTDCIFLAPHIRDMMMADSRPQESSMELHTIPCGVDLDKWTFKERQPGKNIAIVGERWISKGVDYVIQLALLLKDQGYVFHWLGPNKDYHWEAAYLHDMIERHSLPIILTEEFIEDLDGWLEDKNYLLSASHKETYGYNIAEAMAKGIKPIIHEFYGFGPIWGNSKWTWATIDQAVKLITEPDYNSDLYRQYLIDNNLHLEGMMNSFDKILWN